MKPKRHFWCPTGNYIDRLVEYHCDLCGTVRLLRGTPLPAHRDGAAYCSLDCLDVNGGPCDTDGGGPCQDAHIDTLRKTHNDGLEVGE